MAIQRIVTFGDSVPWGQGLTEPEKYDSLVTNATGAGQLQRLAHSGATIGTTLIASGPADSEVPVSRPTILDQCNNFNDSTDTVDLILMNGGINDVDIRNILNPLVPTPLLSAMTQSFCHDSMLTLLRAVAAKFAGPNCRIIVTGYYQILSTQSDKGLIPNFLGLHGIAAPVFLVADDVIAAVAARCLQFFQESTAAFEQAVKDLGDKRVVYVDAGFTEANSVFAPDALLWGVNEDATLSPQDDVIASRHASCDAAFSAVQVLEREQCYRASAGHPNRAGAQQFANRILAAI